MSRTSIHSSEAKITKVQDCGVGPVVASGVRGGRSGVHRPPKFGARRRSTAVVSISTCGSGSTAKTIRWTNGWMVGSSPILMARHRAIMFWWNRYNVFCGDVCYSQGSMLYGRLLEYNIKKDMYIFCF